MKKPIALIIMDGFGCNTSKYGNAVFSAKTPNFDKLLKTYPHTLISASGLSVGLPVGQMGNSEVGHTNIGAGRVVYQELTRISKSITDGDFFENQAFVNAINHCKKHNSALHIMGLLSDGGVHSHNEHIYALVELAKKSGLEKVFLHCFLDGRDVPPCSGREYVADLEQKLEALHCGKIATVMGRFYAMDRDNRWDRVNAAYAAMVYGEGNQVDCGTCAVKESYDDGKTDEFVLPAVIRDTPPISANDAVIFANFRPDRARELTRAFVDENFSGFDRKKGGFPLYFVCMTQYDATMPNVHIAFQPQSLKNTFGEYISQKGLTQLRIAETEKYAHVTFFFNGGVERIYPNEDRALIPSPKVTTYDMKPEMSAFEVTAEMEKRVASDKYDVIVLNFANCDMVGHTGMFDKAVLAVETVDTCLGRVVNAIASKGGVCLITADHGNAEQMYAEDGSPFTAHTINQVPFLVTDPFLKLREGGMLADIAPTMLKLLKLPQPVEMTGKSLVE